MQPFGLFSLLQTLLDKPKTEEPTATPTDFSTEKAEENTPPATVQEENHQAILEFLQAHETRAQKTRKR